MRPKSLPEIRKVTLGFGELWEGMKEGPCVGGSVDGKFLCSPLPKYEISSPQISEDHDSEKKDVYEAEPLVVNNNLFWIWRHESLTIDQAISMLVRGYRPQWWDSTESDPP